MTTANVQTEIFRVFINGIKVEYLKAFRIDHEWDHVTVAVEEYVPFLGPTLVLSAPTILTRRFNNPEVRIFGQNIFIERVEPCGQS